jgi:hypothetical protein
MDNVHKHTDSEFVIMFGVADVTAQGVECRKRWDMIFKAEQVLARRNWEAMRSLGYDC